MYLSSECMKIREFWVTWRRYRFGMLLFSVCLSAILAAPQVAMSTQPNIIAEANLAAEVIKKQTAKPSKAPTVPAKTATNFNGKCQKDRIRKWDDHFNQGSS